MRGPVRIQRKRTRGWKMPPNTVYVGRPSKWGNPVVHPCSKVAADQFRKICKALPPLRAQIRRELRGKNLACWCPLDQPCHADVLLELANSPKGMA